MKIKFYPLLLAILLSCQWAFSQNLIINPGGELPATTGWTIVSKGTDCYNSSDWHIQGNQNGFPSAREGNYFFFSGCNSVNGQIYQDIDVSSLAADIDASNLNFTFSGYMQVFNQSPADGAMMKIEYFNASDVLVSSYNTGITKNVGVWTQYVSTITAMPGTRRVRITLRSFVYTGPSVDAYFDDLSLISVQLLPLKLMSFTTALDRSNAVIADWKTANEMNNDHFELQRSKDGIAWETVDRVQGAGTTNTIHSYTAKDNYPIEGLSYYRLIQFDLDGKMSVSKVNTIKTENSNARLLAYPNPARSKLTVEGDQETLREIAVFASNGKNVNSVIQKSVTSPTRLELNVSVLPRGIYYIKANGKSTIFYKQ